MLSSPLRVDELEEGVVSYWCNHRTEGFLRERHTQGLSDTTTTSGTTDRLRCELFSDKMDLRAMGHEGPATEEQKRGVKAGPTTIARPKSSP